MFLVNKLCNSLIYNFCNNCFCGKSKVHKFLTHIKLSDGHPHMHAYTHTHSHSHKILEGVFMLLWLKASLRIVLPQTPIKNPSPDIQSICTMVSCSHTKHAQTDGTIPFSTVLYRGKWGNRYSQQWSTQHIVNALIDLKGKTSASRDRKVSWRKTKCELPSEANWNENGGKGGIPMATVSLVNYGSLNYYKYTPCPRGDLLSSFHLGPRFHKLFVPNATRRGGGREEGRVVGFQ